MTLNQGSPFATRFHYDVKSNDEVTSMDYPPPSRIPHLYSVPCWGYGSQATVPKLFLVTNENNLFLSIKVTLLRSHIEFTLTSLQANCLASTPFLLQTTPLLVQQDRSQRGQRDMQPLHPVRSGSMTLQYFRTIIKTPCRMKSQIILCHLKMP